jgi:hypothetical protein
MAVRPADHRVKPGDDVEGPGDDVFEIGAERSFHWPIDITSQVMQGHGIASTQ